jgi:hypothetical protein
MKRRLALKTAQTHRTQMMKRLALHDVVGVVSQQHGLREINLEDAT